MPTAINRPIIQHYVWQQNPNNGQWYRVLKGEEKTWVFSPTKRRWVYQPGEEVEGHDH